MGGGLLSVVALSQAPVSVVQPIASGGLAVLAVFSHFYLEERLSQREWLAVGLAAAGTVGVAATAPEAAEGASTSFSYSGLLALLLLLLLASAAMRAVVRRVAGGGGQRRVSSARGSSSANARAEELSYGAAAGCAYALSASCCRAGMLAASASAGRPAALLGLLASACFTAVGVVAQTRGLKDGSAMVVCTVAAVASMLTGLAAGLLCLGERLPATAKGVFAWLLSWAAIAAGVGGLSGSLGEGWGGGGEKGGAPKGLLGALGPGNPALILANGSRGNLLPLFVTAGAAKRDGDSAL